ncbi:zinc finger BED domain-containing protein RICESLEEPER 2-like [Senna tora]|uniref:Zinc finger BED domain-containing protein RICESLEEPER 2-like n=1 Tax=Senna tora TaxID=362788 RepID=A0A834WF07_9FABA|nr:zinc finger BED domain-containing protein RICESLEEPER 2-like [Senna tora]
MEPPHSGVELARKIFNFLKEWGIDRKIFSLTLDNASANDSMQSILKEHLSLQNSLLCRGEFFHVRCCAHILNLIVQEGLKVASGALNKIRESIKYVKASEARMVSFNECVAQVGGIDTGMGLRLDVSTRWNSTYVMLESAIKYRRAFGSLSLFDKNFKNCPSNEEWMRAEKMKDFLLPFNVFTNLFSGSSYPTSNMYFMQIWKIECLLIENLGVDDLVIQDMATRMKEKFDKYWSDYSVILAIAIVLDPRMKFDALKFCYSKLHPINWEQKLENIKTKLYTLFAQYETRDDGASSSSVAVPPTPLPSTTPLSSINSKDAYWDYIDYVCQTESPVGKSELDKYLEEPKLKPKFHEKLDVLGHWRDHQNEFPSLSKMACDILSIPITTVASESAFSIGSRVLSKYRCSLLPNNVQALICTRNWLHGYNFEDDGDDNDNSTSIELKNSKQDSNDWPSFSSLIYFIGSPTSSKGKRNREDT